MLHGRTEKNYFFHRLLQNWAYITLMRNRNFIKGVADKENDRKPIVEIVRIIKKKGGKCLK